MDLEKEWLLLTSQDRFQWILSSDTFLMTMHHFPKILFD